MRAIAAKQLCALLTSAFAAAGARGAVIALDARVVSAVQELINGQPASVNANADETTPDRGPPIAASSQLNSTDLGGALVGVGQAFSEFLDPARLDEPNPREFALEAACFSDDAEVSYEVDSSAMESRRVLFVRAARDGVPREIDFGFSDTAEVTSRVFLSGAIVLWATNAAADLDSIAADVRVSITREADGESLFSTSVVLRPDGDDVSVATTGPIIVDEISVDQLATLGLDDGSAAALADLAEAGLLRLIVVPTQSHRYSYEVTADEELTLTAQLDVGLRGAAGGTGVAAVLGRPFQNLADFVQSPLPGVDGAKLQQTINLSIADRAARGASGPALCGAVGGEALLAIIPLALVSAGRRRRGRITSRGP